MSASAIVKDGSVSRTDINTPEIETIIPALHKVTQRCQDLRNAAKPILGKLLAYRFPGGRASKGGYYYLPENVSSYTILSKERKFKVSLGTGFIYTSLKGKNFILLCHDDGRYFDILDLWRAREEGTSLVEACAQLAEDIRWISRESPEERERRMARQRRLDKQALLETYANIRYEMSFWMENDEVGTFYETAGRKFWKIYGESFGYSLSHYKFLDMLRTWAEDKSDVWFTVEEVKVRARYVVYRLTKTAVTDETLLARERAEEERLKAEEKQRREEEEEARYRESMRQFELEEQQREAAEKQVTDRLQSLKTQYKDVEKNWPTDTSEARRAYYEALNKLNRQLEPLFQATRKKDEWWTFYRWLKD
jgi:hypothetical protein